MTNDFTREAAHAIYESLDLWTTTPPSIRYGEDMALQPHDNAFSKRKQLQNAHGFRATTGFFPRSTIPVVHKYVGPNNDTRIVAPVTLCL